MIGNFKLSNNEGQTGGIGAIDVAPVHGTGQTATDAATGGDETLTVVAGAAYAITVDSTDAWVFGIADVTTAANVAWMCPASGTIVIHVPIGYDTLHMQCLANGGTMYLTEIQQ